MKKLLLLCLFATALLTSCKKENNGPQAGQEMIGAGFGASQAPFAGQPWQLPQGVVLKDSIRDASWWVEVKGGQPVGLQTYNGTPGGVFTVCLLLQNSTGSAISIQFPQELLLLSSNNRVQNGVILLPQTVIIPAHEELAVFAGAFCVNMGRDVPDLYTATGNLQAFSFGPATVPAALKEISELLKTKNFTYSSLLQGGSIDMEKLAKASVIQNAVWEVTDEGGLTTETRKALQAL